MTQYDAEWLKKEAKDFKETKEKLLPLAIKGDPDAQTDLGWLYNNHHKPYTKETHQESFKWFEKAAKQGDPDAQDQMGGMFMLGDFGVKRNLKTAIKWFSLAASGGQAESLDMLEDLVDEKEYKVILATYNRIYDDRGNRKPN